MGGEKKIKLSTLRFYAKTGIFYVDLKEKKVFPKHSKFKVSRKDELLRFVRSRKFDRIENEKNLFFKNQSFLKFFTVHQNLKLMKMRLAILYTF